MKPIYAVVAAVLIIAGGLGGYFYYSDSNLVNNQNTGSMAISVADLPASPTVTGVNITFSSVALHSNTTGWTNYSVTTKTVDIFGLTTSNASLLSSITLKDGKYTMIRLYISKVTVSFGKTQVNFTLNAPFAFVNHPFNVSKGSTTNVILDFNLQSDMNTHSDIFTPNIGNVVTKQ